MIHSTADKHAWSLVFLVFNCQHFGHLPESGERQVGIKLLGSVHPSLFMILYPVLLFQHPERNRKHPNRYLLQFPYAISILNLELQSYCLYIQE